jgi:hypothetical protein
MSGSPTALLSRRGSSPLRPRGSHPSLREGSDLVMSLKYPETREGTTVHTDLESKAMSISICLFVPLPKGSTVKKEVIR